jgi:8-oxo-dGTP diphosphatase
MTKYVLGFCFTPNLNYVVLIEKKRPEWQAGKLNAIGGHIEEGETPLQAMRREFIEETSLSPTNDWTKFGVLRSPSWETHLFHTTTTRTLPIQSTDELADLFHVTTILDNNPPVLVTVPDLPWLLATALNHIKHTSGRWHPDTTSLTITLDPPKDQ